MTRLITGIAMILLTIYCSACGKQPQQGPQGVSGSIGAQGMTGAQGIKGPTGSPGTDAATVRTVELCPGFVPSYPNSFPEYALCIQGNLWGVYSDHGGFLTELPPGAYSSDGINASCNLLIEANCQVERQ